MKTKGFIIQELGVEKNKFLGELQLNLIDENDNFKKNYYTTIIGQNGTGKSYTLQTIINIFREIFDYKKTKKRSYHILGKFYIKYFMDGNVYKVGNNSKEEGLNRLKESDIVFFKNKSLIENLEELKLPEKILASSIMLTDKFPVVNVKQGFDIYSYLGVRRSPSIAGTRTLARITAQYLIEISGDDSVKEKIKEIQKYLNIKGDIVISYSPRYYKQIYDLDLQIKDLAAFYNDYPQKKGRGTPLWGDAYFRKIENNFSLIGEIINYIKSIIRRMDLDNKTFSLRPFDENVVRNDFEMINHLEKLDLITYPSIQIVNNETRTIYSLEESSSGEYHIFTSLIGLLAKAKDNSLILIDEPEISMHPNWQMQYFEILNKLFETYTGCHFIIATHSHFLISDLKGENSKIIGFKREYEEDNNRVKNVIRVTELQKNLNTFGWSAEQILLEVFQVPTTRNYFIAEKVGEILEMVSEINRNDVEIGEKVKTIINSNIISLSDEDPLKPVINRLIEKYG